jgi:PAS domain S-box-containing protein
VNIQIQPVFNSKGQVVNFISIQKEITKEKEIEQELISTTAFQKAILNSADIAIISTDLTGIIQSFNPAACKMLGYESNEIVGRQTPIIFHIESEVRSILQNQPEFKACYFGICDDRWDVEMYQVHSEKNEYTFVRKDGSRFPVSLTTSTLRNENGEVSGFLGMAEDITQRKDQYDALQLANLKFRSLISSMQAGIMVEDEYRKIVLVNQYFCDLFSIPVAPEQLIGADCFSAAEVSKELFRNPESFIQDIESTLAVGQPVTSFELQFKNGTTVERDFIPIEDAAHVNHGILWIYRDITHRKKNERDLQRQSKILSGTAQATNHLLTLPDHNEAIQKALETIGLATNIDRVYIFENEVDEITGNSFFSQRFEWVADGISPQIDNPELQYMPYSTSFPRWYNLLSAGKTVSGLTKDFPDLERKILESEDIISIIVAPIFVRDQLWGMVGFDDCTVGINWPLNEISILTALAGSIGGSIARRLMEKELITARHLAEYATKTKSDFLATMSHEIRTPMNGVIGMTSLLMQTQLTADQRDYAETIKVSGELLLSVINDILDFSKVESGKLVLEEYQFDLRLAIEDVIDLLAVSALEKNLGLYFHIDPSIPAKVTADLTRLRQILVNLTGNAIKFTKQGEVVIRVKQVEQIGSEAILEFSVKDSGVGIPKEKIDLLFKPFSQVDASTTRKFGGTGLGLAICAKFVELMHGNIWVKSEENQGSQFFFTIKTHYETNETNQQNATSGTDLVKGKRILVVDANPVSRYILCSIFDNIQVKTHCTDSISASIKLLENSKDIDLVLLEYDFPEKIEEGAKLEIQKLKKLENTPVLLITNPASSSQLPFIQDYFPHRINKPLKHSQLIAYVTTILTDQKSNKMPVINPPKQFQKINDLFPLNILVAEDNAINQKLITLLFQMLGYQIHIAANGYEVLEALNRLKIDIVFMDIQMPEMDGFEATRQIIANWGSQRPLIIAMTANALRSDEEQCLAAGMDDYISKPLTISQVKEGIEKWALLCNK